MPINTARSPFISKPLRYKTAEDMSVKTLYPNAEEYVIDSQGSEEDAAELAPDFLAVLKVPTEVYGVKVDSAIYSDEFADALPRYNCTFPDYGVSGLTTYVTVVKIDYQNDRSEMEVRS